MSQPTPPPTDAEALIAVLAEEARRGARDAGVADDAPEPEPEELLDFLVGRLPADAERRFERRLVADPAAARALLDVADLADAEAGAATAPTDLAARGAWRDFQARLAASSPAAAVSAGRRAAAAPAGPAAQRRSPPWLAVAAGLLLATSFGLGGWVWVLDRERGRPIGNLATLELAAGTRAGAEPTVEVAAGAPLLLILAPAERCPRYDAELAGPEGRGPWSVELVRDELGNLTLQFLPAGPGPYALRLSGCEPRRRLEEHGFRIVRPRATGPGGGDP